MKTNIKTYLNSLSEDILTLSIECIDITVLPDLTRFKNLKELYCSDNKLSYLPTTLPQSLEILYCSKNQLTYLPTLPEKILYLIYWDNPICNILDNNNNSLIKVKQKIIILNNFRHLNYSLRSKKRFIKWLWKSREKKIMEKYHPNYLLENLEENTDLDEFLNNWYIQ